MLFPLISHTFSANSYLLIGEKSAVIDPGIFPSPLISEIEKQKISLDYIICTHCHYDHVASLPELKEKFSGKILIHELDASALENGNDAHIYAKSFNSSFPKIKIDQKLKEGDLINLGKGITLKVIHTPGHSPGSICLYYPQEKSLFSGDTIFTEGVGRTDLTGGNWDDLKKSWQKILKLKQEEGINKLYPGHGSIGSGEDIERVYELYF